MKYLYIILLTLLFPLFSYANSQIDIEVDENNIELWDTITITISLSDINLQQTNAEISLPWVENFDVFSQSVSNSFQNINGVSQSLTQLILQLTAKNTWEFELGPVEILWNEILKDNEKLNIRVGLGSTNFIPPVTLDDTQEYQEPEQNLTKDMIPWENSEDLKWLREINFPLWAHGAFLIFFVGAFYLLLSYVLKSDTSNKPKQEHLQVEDTSDQYKKYFKNLLWEIGALSSEDFFHQYNIWLRKIFGDLWVSQYHSATLSEFQKHTVVTQDKRFAVFKKSYKHEYSWVNISQETQKKYINDILELL